MRVASITSIYFLNAVERSRIRRGGVRGMVPESFRGRWRVVRADGNPGRALHIGRALNDIRGTDTEVERAVARAGLPREDHVTGTAVPTHRGEAKSRGDLQVGDGVAAAGAGAGASRPE